MKRYLPHCIISALGLVLALGHVAYPHVKIDAVTLGFLVIAVLPWLGFVFKSLELPGGLKVEYQEKKLVRMSPVEIQRKAQAEVDFLAEETAPIESIESEARKYRAVEETMLAKVEECFSRTYEVLVNRRLGPTEYDAILQSHSDDTRDVIVEIKFIQKGFKYGWLREVASRVTTGTQLYRSRTGRRARSVVLIILGEILTEPARRGRERKEMRDTVLQELGQLGAKLKIHFIEARDIQDIDCLRLGILLLPEVSGPSQSAQRHHPKSFRRTPPAHSIARTRSASISSWWTWHSSKCSRNCFLIQGTSGIGELQGCSTNDLRLPGFPSSNALHIPPKVPPRKNANIAESCCWSGGTGRRTRLKISRCVNSVGVQLPPPAPTIQVSNCAACSCWFNLQTK
jgi:hypothetical protein